MNVLNILTILSDTLYNLLFFEIFHIPFLILLFISIALYFTIYLGFPNIRMFKHGLDVIIKNKYYSSKDSGEIAPRQAFFASIASVIGLGNIAGVAVAVSVGGPGAIMWMMIMAFFGMSTVFAEVILGHKYKYMNKDRTINGGPFRYLQKGLKASGYRRFGIFLSFLFAFLSILSGIGGSAIFQTHEAINSLMEFSIFSNQSLMLSIIFTVFTGFVIIGGIKRLSKVMDTMAPFMIILYIVSCFIILIYNLENIMPSLVLIFKDAFTLVPIRGAFLGMLITGAQRSSFSNEAGLGSTTIIYSTSKTKEPVRIASVAILSPVLDTMIINFITGLVIIASNVYNLPNAKDGILLTRQAFTTVSHWFPIMLTFVVLLFATSTLMGSGYSSQSAWAYVFGKKSVFIFNIIYCLAVFFASQLNFASMIKIADTFVLAIAIPNIIGLFMLRKIIKNEYFDYLKKWKKGVFDKKVKK
jgi:alanine or glycine:cation symporter, AGCS family